MNLNDYILMQLVEFRYGKNILSVKIVTILVTVLLKMTLCIYFVFTKNPLF